MKDYNKQIMYSCQERMSYPLISSLSHTSVIIYLTNILIDSLNNLFIVNVRPILFVDKFIDYRLLKQIVFILIQIISR